MKKKSLPNLSVFKSPCDGGLTQEWRKCHTKFFPQGGAGGEGTLRKQLMRREPRHQFSCSIPEQHGSPHGVQQNGRGKPPRPLGRYREAQRGSEIQEILFTKKKKKKKRFCSQNKSLFHVTVIIFLSLSGDLGRIFCT